MTKGVTFEEWCRTKGLTPSQCDDTNMWIRQAFEDGKRAYFPIPKENAVEMAARSIYELLPPSQDSNPKDRPWVTAGNSFKQDEARRYARAALETLSPGIFNTVHKCRLAELYQESAFLYESSFNWKACYEDYVREGHSRGVNYYAKSVEEAVIEACGEACKEYVPLIHASLFCAWNDVLEWAESITGKPLPPLDDPYRARYLATANVTFDGEAQSVLTKSDTPQLGNRNGNL